MKSRQMWITVALSLVSIGTFARQQRPAEPAQAGKGVMVGTVIDGVTNAPIANATVNLSADGNRTRASVIADDQGRFVFSEAPAGRLVLTSDQTGYMTGYYGYRSPFGANQYFDLADGEKVTDVVIRMWKNASVSGTVTDANHDPVVGASVVAAPVDVVGGRTAILGGRQVTTDDRGMYRLAGLTPATYAIVMPSPANLTPVSRGFSASGYPTVFYPDTTASETASLLTLGGGDDRSGVDFHVTRHPSFSVSGTVVGRAAGQSRRIELSLRPTRSNRISTSVDVRRTAADAEGHFTFPGVLPGPYVIEVIDVPIEAAPAGTARMAYSQTGNGMSMIGNALPGRGNALPLPPAPSAPTLWAAVPVALEDGNLDDVQVALVPGARISGRLVFDGAADKLGEATLLSTPVLPMSADGRELGMLPASGIRADGSFQTVGLPPGQYQVMFLFNAPGWSLASIDLGGQEMIARPFELGATDLTNVVFKFIDHPTQFSGLVTNDAGKPAGDATIYAFSTDRRSWLSTAPMAAITREVRPARNGTYQMRLPPGEYFVIAVLETAQQSWRRADALEALAKAAKTAKVAAGQTVTLNLAVAKGK